VYGVPYAFCCFKTPIIPNKKSGHLVRSRYVLTYAGFFVVSTIFNISIIITIPAIISRYAHTAADSVIIPVQVLMAK